MQPPMMGMAFTGRVEAPEPIEKVCVGDKVASLLLLHTSVSRGSVQGNVV